MEFGFESYFPSLTPMLLSYFSGFKNKDVAFYHPSTKTMIQADLLFNLPPTEQVESFVESHAKGLTALFSIRNRNLLGKSPSLVILRLTLGSTRSSHGVWARIKST
jgi:hypothetical protein